VVIGVAHEGDHRVAPPGQQRGEPHRDLSTATRDHDPHGRQPTASGHRRPGVDAARAQPSTTAATAPIEHAALPRQIARGKLAAMAAAAERLRCEIGS
jgi:hypothetical protein